MTDEGTAASSLVAWGVDAMVAGFDLARWMTDYVDLEESMAVGSICQELLAQAEVLLELGGLDASARDSLVYDTAPGEWPVSGLAIWPAPSWPETVVRGFLLSAALLATAASLRRTADAADVLAIVEAEQALHHQHWQRWVRALGTGDHCGELVAAAATGVARCADLFGPPAALEDRRVLADWRARVAEGFDPLGVDVEPVPVEVPRGADPTTEAALARLLDAVRANRSSRVVW